MFGLVRVVQGIIFCNYNIFLHIEFLQDLNVNDLNWKYFENVEFTHDVKIKFRNVYIN